MDVSLVQTPSDVSMQNYYEVMDTTPQAFMSLNQSSFKKLYRELSKKYHPDKNTEDTTDKF